MNDKNKLRKTIILWSLYAVLMIATILVFVFNTEINGGPLQKITDPGTGEIIKVRNPESVFKIDTTSDFLKYIVETGVPALLNTIRIVGIAITLAIALHYLAKVAFHSKKGKTLSRLLVSFFKWVIALCAIFFTMDAWGANTTTILASAGVVTLIIGLGSQSLVSDILAGIFIVFEGDFQVGDIVIIDGWRGEVKSIGIRTTKMMDAGGNIKIINNSDIRSIINQTKDLSVAKCYVGISYGDRIEKVEKVIADNLPKIKERIPKIIEGPFYKGVAELAESSVNLLFVAKCKEKDIYQVQRDLNREIKICFDDNNINIPFPQITVSYDEGSDKKSVSNRVIKQAEQFVEEQKDLSKDIDNKKIVTFNRFIDYNG